MNKLKRIAIIGPESTGKSTLTVQLADYMNGESVSEYARQYIDELDRPYNEADLLVIAKRQLELEDEVTEKARDYLFCDTNLIVIKVWSELKYGRVDPWIINSISTREYDYYLLLDVDLPWEPDPQREHPNDRGRLFNTYKSYLETNQLPFSTVSGHGDDRLRNAVAALENYFPIP